MKSSSSWDLFMKALSPSSGERILDVGAGKGSVANRVLAETKGTELYALEPDEKRVAYMKRRVPQVKSFVERSEKMPFDDSFFDKAYTTMAVHHFSDVDAALAEFSRVLKDGGRLVILDIDPSRGIGRLARFFENTVMRRHLMFSRPGQMEDRLRASGRFVVSDPILAASGYLVLCTVKA